MKSSKKTYKKTDDFYLSKIWSNEHDTTENCKEICNIDTNKPIKGKILNRYVFTKIINKIKQNGISYRPQPYRYIYAITEFDKILYHKVNTFDEHYVDGIHFKLCPGITFEPDDEPQMIHPCLVEGAPVKLAGEFQIYMNSNSTIDVHLNDMSGHYMEQVDYVVDKSFYRKMIRWLKLQFKKILPNDVKLIVHSCSDYPDENCNEIPIIKSKNKLIKRFNKYIDINPTVIIHKSKMQKKSRKSPRKKSRKSPSLFLFIKVI